MRMQVISNVTQKNLRAAIGQCVDTGAVINTHDAAIYRNRLKDFAGHDVVNHTKKQYVLRKPNGRLAHINTCESFFRGIIYIVTLIYCVKLLLHAAQIVAPFSTLFLQFEQIHLRDIAPPIMINIKPRTIPKGKNRKHKTTPLNCIADPTPTSSVLCCLRAGSGVAPVSGHSKPATKGRMKTSHFEGSIASWAAWAALGRNERTQCEPAAFDINFGGQRLVQPADCA
jgi:hypothetical protein